MEVKEFSGKAVVIVLDSVGIGALPDAHLFGDAGTHTLLHTAEAIGAFDLPGLGALGLGNIASLPGLPPAATPLASFGKMAERSVGKDTSTGHWELTGLFLDQPFATFPGGFPPEIIKPFEKAIGREVLGNKVSSGTVILDELGEEHVRTKRPIVYTSADSVFQIAAHEEVIPLKTLYEWAVMAQRLVAPHRICRVITRPFIGGQGHFKRTYNRKDFSMEPPAETLLDRLKGAGREVVGIGKIEDIFAGRGITKAIHTEGNADGLAKTLGAMNTYQQGLIFVNLVDFDMVYGHRRNPEGYAKALDEVDAFVPELMGALGAGDLLFFTADHGCDPSFAAHTDHTREYVPLLVLRGGAGRGGRDLGTRETFADLGQTLAEAFQIPPLDNGVSFLEEL